MARQLQNIHQDQVEKWRRYGHEPVYERGTVRLRELRKSIPPDLDVTVFNKEIGGYVPLMLSCGRALKCGEVLPERADLAIDDKGRLLSQGEFEQNYMAYLAAFSYTEGSDINFEPVPYVVNFVKETPDVFGDTKAMIEIGFDPKMNEEFKPKSRFGPNGESEEEWLKESAKNAGNVSEAISKMTELLAQLTAMQTGAVAATAPPVMTVPDPIVMTAADVAEAVGESTEETAPCGKRIRRGYLAQHQRFCNSDDCGGKGENTVGPEAE